MSAAGENFAVSAGCKLNFILQNKRRRRKFWGFRASQRGFYIGKWTLIDTIPPGRERRRRKKSRFWLNFPDLRSLKVPPHSPSVKVPGQICKSSRISLERIHGALPIHPNEQVPTRNPPGEFGVTLPSYLDGEHAFTAAGCKQMHSWFMRPNILPRAMTSDNAPFDLKIGEHLVLGLLSTFQGGGCDYVA